MRVTVLGKSPSWQDAGGACSGYLAEEDGSRLLLDCGNGVFGKLRAAVDYTTIDAVVLSHLHADHFLDLVPFSYALTYSPRGASARPVLHAPPGAGEIFRRVAGAWGSEDLIEKAFDLREYDGGEPLEVGPITVRLHEVAHFVQTFAVELRSGAGRFVFGADTGPSDALVAFAEGADVLMAEATLIDADDGHLTATQAGEHAARAGVGRLVLTHLSDEIDLERALSDARETFGGPVELAREGAVYEI
jgi:ribonuclease BN (tRNA processing enzyme)